MFDRKYLKLFLLFSSSIILLLSSCKNEFKGSDYVAYFGGEIVNPSTPYVLFCKDNEIIDTLKLDKNNRFFKKFDSLAPGLYTFKHEPEYQYVYFDKNDSIMVNVNSKDFDGSLVFCGRGDEKNNFLMDLYLRNEKDKNNMFEVFDYDIDKFTNSIDSTYAQNNAFYAKNKEIIRWKSDFDKFAKAAVDFHNFSKRELYPYIHKMRTGNDVYEKLPKDYYDFRKTVDYNNETLNSFSPYVMYLSNMLNNMATINYHNHFSQVDLALKTNINKIKIADTLIKNEKVKNTILNTIAFQYLLEDQNITNNSLFIDTYYKYSTDKSYKNEILKISNAVQLLKPDFELPLVKLLDTNGNEVASDKVITKNTVIFFWSEKAEAHLVAVHKKVLAFKAKYPAWQFVAVNLDDNQGEWQKVLSHYAFNGTKEFRCKNFENIKAKWAITKIHRTIVVGNDGKIKNAFTNIFDVHFEDNLK